MKRKIVIATAVAALMAGGTLTAFAATGSDSGDRTPPAAKVSLAEATDAALAKVPGTVESADRDDDGKGDWEIEIRTAEGTEREVRVDAQDGSVRIESGDDRDDDRDEQDDDRHDGDGDDRDGEDGRDHDRDDAAAAAAAKTTSAQAQAAALKLHPGTVTEVEFDDARWQIDIKGKDGKAYEVDVDAATAKATTDRDN
ncbi:PepSY domain-containing protein [Streptomyces sp. NPDC003691]